jgi:23S rRNA (uracil1939-C5)-methyltransferase
MTTLEITKLSHDGRGVGRDSQGKTVFVDGVLPGETVSYTIKSQKRRYNDAQVLEILTPAVDRVTPKCVHFLTCGGCAQQHISHNAQLEAKQQSLLEQLQHFGQVQPKNILPPLTGPIWGYRTKARLGVKYVIKKEKVLVGFRERQKAYLADIDSCEVLHPKAGQLISALKTFIQTLDCYQTIAQIEVAVGNEQLALIFRNLEPLSATDEQSLIHFAQQHTFDLYLQPAGPESVTKIHPADDNPRLFYSLPDYNLKLTFHPNDFTQINPELNRSMINQAINLLQLQPEDQILDLFCGLGNFTLPMATIAKSVIGIEGSEAMVERGYENAKLNNITNVNFMAADLTTDQSSAIWAQQNYTKVLLDPPRSGAAEVLPLVSNLGAEMILYVSCNPATLARDSGILCRQYGYSLEYVGIMDMFPHTMHVETMALFVRAATR